MVKHHYHPSSSSSLFIVLVADTVLFFVTVTFQVCFVCGLERTLIDRQGPQSHPGYDYHVKHEHDIWMYVFLPVRLQLLCISL